MLVVCLLTVEPENNVYHSRFISSVRNTGILGKAWFSLAT